MRPGQSSLEQDNPTTSQAGIKDLAENKPPAPSSPPSFWSVMEGKEGMILGPLEGVF